MKNIIVPTDFSKNALSALLVAYSLANRNGAQLTVIHAYRRFYSAFQPPAASEKDSQFIQEEAEKSMEQLQNQLIDMGLDTRFVQFVCAVGELSGILRDLSRQTTIGLVVMGTTGASGFKYHFLGSNTFDVARNARFPMLVVPAGVEHFNLQKIVFLTDFQPRDRNTLARIVHLFGHEHVHVHLVHILESKSDQGADAVSYDATKSKLEDWSRQLCETTGLKQLPTEIMVEAKRGEALERLAEEKKPDLLALTMVERTFWDLLTNKSMAKAIIMQSKTPVFIEKN